MLDMLNMLDVLDMLDMLDNVRHVGYVGYVGCVRYVGYVGYVRYVRCPNFSHHPFHLQQIWKDDVKQIPKKEHLPTPDIDYQRRRVGRWDTTLGFDVHADRFNDDQKVKFRENPIMYTTTS